MSTTIRTAVERHVPRGYENQARPALRELDRQVSNAAQSIRNAARREGINAQRLEEVLIASGLVERPAPPVQPTARPATPSEGLGQQVQRLADTVDRLVSAAQRHGLRL